MKPGWKSTQYKHGLRAICEDVDGEAVPLSVDIVHADKLASWLEWREDLLMMLWAEAAECVIHDEKP